jgi:hypothetical protein
VRWGDKRRLRAPELLVGLGLVLLLVVGLVAILVPHGGHHAAPTTTTATTAPPPATTTTAAPQGLFATEPTLTPTSPSSVELRFATTAPARASVTYGIDGLPPTLWLGDAHAATEHVLQLDGAVFTRQYRIELRVTSGGRSDAKELILPPRRVTNEPQATIAKSVLVLDGHPFFPQMSWAECPPQMSQALGAGIDVFLNDPCGGVAEQAQTLQGQALLAGMATDGDTGVGQIGFAYPDEPDGLGMEATGLPTPLLAGPGRVAFMTLTNHFFSGAAPLPKGRGMYPALIAKADVVGFDLYPLQEWCRRSRIADVAAAQRELVHLAAGKPTFQWIEAGAMQKCNGPDDALTPATVRAETLLALVGGAHGMAFFPPELDAGLVPAVTEVTRTLDAVSPALLSSPVGSQASGGVLVRATAYRGGLYVVAVNPGTAAVTSTIAVHGLNDRPLTVLDESRTVRAHGSSFTETFPPLAARVYVAAPTWAR